jgi:hypothetical protein
VGGVPVQGRRTLSSFAANDLREEVDIPASHSTFHGDALLVRVPLEERDGEPFNTPRQVVGSMSISGPTLVLSERHIKAPVKRVFNVPVTADSLGKSFGIQIQ